MTGSSSSLRARGGLVDALSSALDRGGHGLSNAPALLKRVLAEEGWREFETARGELVRHESFADFVATPPLKGLGTSASLVKRIVADNPEAADLLDQALQQPKHVHAVGTDSDNITIRKDPNQRGTSRDGALRRLRKDAPELHAQVLAGDLSAHAAMVKAGFRRRSVSVHVDEPDRVAKALRKHMTPKQIQELITQLESDA